LHIQLLHALTQKQSEWATSAFDGTYADAKSQSLEFTTYKQTTKRAWVAERQDVATLFGNVQTKLRTYGLREYVPPEGLSLQVGVNAILVLRTLTQTFLIFEGC
jgi:hypothetical protein